MHVTKICICGQTQSTTVHMNEYFDFNTDLPYLVIFEKKKNIETCIITLASLTCSNRPNPFLFPLHHHFFYQKLIFNLYSLGFGLFKLNW